MSTEALRAAGRTPPAEPLPENPLDGVPALAARATVGKRLPDALYIHVDALRLLPEGSEALIERVREQAQVEVGAYNVLKLGLLSPKLSFLLYANFDDDPFPPLAKSWSVDLASRTVAARQYNTSVNPPILHRKETLLPPDHPRAGEYRALTEALEQRGLLANANAIGWRRAWDERLRKEGVRIVGHSLGELPRVVTDEGREVQVERHRTAIERNVLSTPMQYLWRHGYLDGRHSIFDFGCGRGGDLRALRLAGVDASGWDPHFAPGESQREADVVNLGFVLNVIENPTERREALTRAYALARRLLIVAVMIGGSATTDRFQRFGDGVLTQRNTFQKYFTQEEIRTYLETSLGREPIACAPGVFCVFRSDEEEQTFLAARYTSAPRMPAPAAVQRERPLREPRPRAANASRGKLRPDAELMERLWDAALSVGRVPDADEVPRHDELRRFGKIEKLLTELLTERGREPFDLAATRRRDDIQVFLAMNQFERRRSQGTYPERLRRDLRAFFGKPSAAEESARGLLFSIAKDSLLKDAARSAAASGTGFLDQEHSLQVHGSLLPRLPPILRVYAACAGRLFGDLEGADVVKLHLGSGKVTLLFFDDFEGKPIPMLTERVKVNLRTQSIEFFRYGGEFAPQPLYMKSRYLAPDHLNYATQQAFDASLVQLGLDLSGFGPAWADFESALRSRGLTLRDHCLEPVVTSRS
jgi:DNA phosphorothioation-associated putative methyltransferase